ELADRGAFDHGVGIMVADEPRGKLDAVAIRSDARLADEDHLPLVLGEDDDGADVARATGIFPIPALERPDELALPHQFRRRKIRIPVRPAVRRSAAALNTVIARRRTRRCLVATGVSASRSGIHLRISSATVNFSAAKNISSVSS